MKNLVKCLGLLACLLASCGQTKERTSSPHAFSINDDSQVYFAPGNLEYCPSSATWRFAENPYKTRGMDNENAAEGYEGWIDLFGWGATGLSGVMPYQTEEDNGAYARGHQDIAGTDYDFSKVIDGGYRMFTHTEIHYLLMYRANAEKLFGYGSIEGNKGLFLLPDDWQCPSGISFTPSTSAGFANQYNWYYTCGEGENYVNNAFSAQQWQTIQNAGGVFLPVTGMRYGNEVSHAGISGHYWTSNFYGEEFANCLCLFEKDLFLEGNFDRCYGLGVRLVKDAA